VQDENTNGVETQYYIQNRQNTNEFKRLHLIPKMKNLATHGSHYTPRKKDCKEDKESSIVLVLDGFYIPLNPDPLSKTLKSSFKHIFGLRLSGFSLGRKHLA